MTEIARTIQVISCMLFGLLVTFPVAVLNEYKGTPWASWQLALLFFAVAIVTMGLQVLFEKVYSGSADRKYEWEMKAFKIEAEKLGFATKDIEVAKYLIRSYLIDNPQSTTQDLLDNLDLPATFTNNQATEEALRLGGLISINRYGQDPVTKQWFVIRDSPSVETQYRKFQKKINSREYKQEVEAYGI